MQHRIDIELACTWFLQISTRCNQHIWHKNKCTQVGPRSKLFSTRCFSLRKITCHKCRSSVWKLGVSMLRDGRGILIKAGKCNTVKPVYNGHSMEKQKVVVVGRWPLYRGSKFSRPFHLFSFIQNVFCFEGIFQRIVITT